MRIFKNDSVSTDTCNTMRCFSAQNFIHTVVWALNVTVLVQLLSGFPPVSGSVFIICSHTTYELKRWRQIKRFLSPPRHLVSRQIRFHFDSIRFMGRQHSSTTDKKTRAKSSLRLLFFGPLFINKLVGLVSNSTSRHITPDVSGGSKSRDCRASSWVRKRFDFPSL